MFTDCLTVVDFMLKRDSALHRKVKYSEILDVGGKTSGSRSPGFPPRLENPYCVGWGVKLYSLTHVSKIPRIVSLNLCKISHTPMLLCRKL